MAADLDKLPRSTDWRAFDALTDEDIAEAVASDPDAPPLDVDWSKAKLYYPKGKAPLSIRIDPDVLAFFKATGRRYQTRMNAVLRAYMEHETGKKERCRRLPTRASLAPSSALRAPSPMQDAWEKGRESVSATLLPRLRGRRCPKGG